MKDPSQFDDEQRHRRLMPKQNLSDDEISNLTAFLGWIGKVDNQGGPPRPILVTGGHRSRDRYQRGSSNGDFRAVKEQCGSSTGRKAADRK